MKVIYHPEFPKHIKRFEAQYREPVDCLIMNSVSLTCCKPRGLHQHGLDLGPHPQIDASARRCECALERALMVVPTLYLRDPIPPKLRQRRSGNDRLAFAQHSQSC